MKFLTVPRLQKLSAMMQAVDVGDRIVHARVEAYSCKLAGSDKRAAKEITHAVDSQLSHSAVQQHASLANSQTPLGDLHEPSTKQLLVSLITTLNASFPDYDFSNLRAEQFQRDASPQAAMNAINNLFVTAMESALGVAGFRDELWSALEETVFLHECEIYKFDGLSSEGDLASSSGEDAGKLWSINYFFFHRKQKKMVLLSSEAISKLHLQNTHSQAYQNAMRSRAMHHGGSHDDADDEQGGEFLSESESANSGGLAEDDDAMEAAEEEMLQELAAETGGVTVPQQGGVQGSYVDASLLEWESVPDAEQNHQAQLMRQQQQQQQQQPMSFDNLAGYDSSPSHSSTSSASTVRVRPLPDTAHGGAHMTQQVRLASTKSPQMRAAVGKSFANPILLGGGGVGSSSASSSSSAAGSMLPPRPQGMSMFGGAQSSFSSVGGGASAASNSGGAPSPNMRPAVPLFFQQQ